MIASTNFITRGTLVITSVNFDILDICCRPCSTVFEHRAAPQQHFVVIDRKCHVNIYEKPLINFMKFNMSVTNIFYDYACYRYIFHVIRRKK